MAFSPRSEALLCEAKRINSRLGAQLVLIHAGAKNERLEREMKILLSKVEIAEADVEVIWKEGKPVEVLSEVCSTERIDLLILGAIQNEDMLRYYLGSVARKISRKPPCSLLLITNPQKKSSGLSSVVVNGVNHIKTEHSIISALNFSKAFSVKELAIVEEVETSNLKTRIDDNQSLEKAFREKEAYRKAENNRILEIIKPYKEEVDAKIHMKCIFGRHGYSIGHFAEVTKADLLVMNSPDKKMGFLNRFFPHDLEYVLSDMPCDLMIIHKN